MGITQAASPITWCEHWHSYPYFVLILWHNISYLLQPRYPRAMFCVYIRLFHIWMAFSMLSMIMQVMRCYFLPFFWWPFEGKLFYRNIMGRPTNLSSHHESTFPSLVVYIYWFFNICTPVLHPAYKMTYFQNWKWPQEWSDNAVGFLWKQWESYKLVTETEAPVLIQPEWVCHFI